MECPEPTWWLLRAVKDLGFFQPDSAFPGCGHPLHVGKMASGTPATMTTARQGERSSATFKDLPQAYGDFSSYCLIVATL